MNTAQTSVAGAALDRAVGLVETAWRTSSARRAWSAIWSEPASAARRARIRQATMAASVTALVARQLATGPQPYTWLVPTAVLAATIVFSLIGDRVD